MSILSPTTSTDASLPWKRTLHPIMGDQEAFLIGPQVCFLYIRKK